MRILRSSSSSSRIKMKINGNRYPSFFRIYLGEAFFRERIHVPRAFMDAHADKLSESSWTVKTEKGGSRKMKIERQGSDSFFCKTDWEDFATDHNLGYGDIIVFFLVGKSELDVLLFSQTTSCGIDNKGILPYNNGSADGIDALSHDDEEEDDKKDIEIIPTKATKSKRNMASRSNGRKSKVTSENEVNWTECESEAEGVKIQRFSNVNLSAPYPYFETVVKQSHADKSYMFIPMEFARKTGIIDAKEVKLMMRSRGGQYEKSVRVGISRLDNRVHMTDGWRSFRRVNRIKAGDECSFTLVNPNTKGVMRLMVKKLSK
ncbi:unnamed protein product [Cuscuta europaea]|uniref:TF-B3 domain-containing protein n=1 Tax=Cuscuta europaea TaxID=41803 RepID=A0A9P0YML2_CUSEU|nr:unnamed protein product [Cuscuta europaea]